MKIRMEGGELDIEAKEEGGLRLVAIHTDGDRRANYRFVFELDADESLKMLDRMRDEIVRQMFARGAGTEPSPAYLAARQELEVSGHDYVVAAAARVPDLEMSDRRARFHRAAVAFAEEAKAYL